MKEALMGHRTIHAEQVTTAPAAQGIRQSIRALLANSITRRVPALIVLAWHVLLALPVLKALHLAQFATLEHISSMHSVSNV